MSLPEKCPLCLAKQEKQVVVTAHVYGAEGQGRSFFHCLDCDVRYLYPGIPTEEEQRFYAAEFEGFMAGRAGDVGGWNKVEGHIRANESTRLRRMKYLKPHLESAKNLLEVGCSSGFMLLPLIEAGYACCGVEPSGAFSQYLKNRNFPVYSSVEELQNLNPQIRFDLILHFFVLEHIAQLQVFLESQLALLKPQGKIIFEVPNVADPLHSVYDIPAFERFYWSVAHPWYFSERSLHYLLERLGHPYEILRDQRYDLSNHMIWARDGQPGGMGRFTDALGRELEEGYKQALIQTGNCDTLVGVISKN